MEWLCLSLLVLLLFFVVVILSYFRCKCTDELLDSLFFLNLIGVSVYFACLYLFLHVSTWFVLEYSPIFTESQSWKKNNKTLTTEKQTIDITLPKSNNKKKIYIFTYLKCPMKNEQACALQPTETIQNIVQ